MSEELVKSKTVICKVRLDLLAQVMNLPEGVRIAAIKEGDVFGCVDIRLEGDGLDDRFAVRPGDHISHADLHYDQHFFSKETICRLRSIR